MKLGNYNNVVVAFVTFRSMEGAERILNADANKNAGMLRRLPEKKREAFATRSLHFLGQ